MTMFILCLLQSYSITYITYIHIYMNIYDYSCYGKLLVFRFAISIWAKKSPRRHCERLFGKSNHHFATASCDVDSYGGISHFKTTWLVVDLPLWKVWVRELGWWNSQLNGKNKTNVPTHQFQDPFQASRSDWSDPVLVNVTSGGEDVVGSRVPKVWHLNGQSSRTGSHLDDGCGCMDFTLWFV